MELKEGMYLRTKNGVIAKIENVDLKYQPNYVETDKNLINKNRIKKTSHNIIDLIEERDFVKVRIDGIFINWFMVDLFEDENENEQLGIGCYEDGLLNSISEYRPLNTLEILEVVTKEQFESITYKVGD